MKIPIGKGDCSIRGHAMGDRGGKPFAIGSGWLTEKPD
jgi:hypothetical protein